MPIGRPRWFFQIDGGFFAVVDGGFFRTWAARLHFGKIPKIFGQILRKFSKILAKFANFWEKSRKKTAIFNENFEIRERCKGVHCVDLGESFPTSIYLQKSASIQPRTSRSKFGSQITLLITYRASCNAFCKTDAWILASSRLLLGHFGLYHLPCAILTGLDTTIGGERVAGNQVNRNE